MSFLLSSIWLLISKNASVKAYSAASLKSTSHVEHTSVLASSVRRMRFVRFPSLGMMKHLQDRYEIVKHTRILRSVCTTPFRLTSVRLSSENMLGESSKNNDNINEENKSMITHNRTYENMLQNRILQPTRNERNEIRIKSQNDENVYDIYNWKEHPDLNPTIHFRSWVVPVSGKSVQNIISSKLTQQYLASQTDLIQHLHQRLKLVRDISSNNNNTNFNISGTSSCKLILLHPDTPKIDELPDEVKEQLREFMVLPEDGPVVPIKFSADQFTASYILTNLLPKSAHPVPTSFETVGHIAHLNLKPQHIPYGPLIGHVLLETLPSIETVIHKVGDVSGPYRTYPLQVLAGRNNTRVHLTERGIQLQFDLADVYWCSRLSEERQRLLSVEIMISQPNAASIIIADAFCGVGAFCLQAARNLNCTIWANDWNPKAIEALKVNAIKNGVKDHFERIQCGDAYDFLVDLGLKDKTMSPTMKKGNDGETFRLPDHVILNFPLESPKFLGALRWWPAVEDDNQIIPRVHVYTFARADEETSQSAEDVAVNLVASNLLPSMSSSSSINRRTELDDDYSCRISVHPVRDVAPGKLVMCVSFSATPKLLRYMQGDFR